MNETVITLHYPEDGQRFRYDLTFENVAEVDDFFSTSPPAPNGTWVKIQPQGKHDKATYLNNDTGVIVAARESETI